MRLLIILSLYAYSFSSTAKDLDQEFKDCGLYKVGAKLICAHSDECKLVFSEDALSTREIIIEKSKYSLSYFKDSYVISDVKIIKINPKTVGKLLAPPVQQVKAIKKDFAEIAQKEECQ